MTFDDFVRGVGNEVGLDLRDAVMSSRLDEDLLLDSIARYELILVVEDIAGRALPEDLIDGIETLGDAFEWAIVGLKQTPSEPTTR